MDEIVRELMQIISGRKRLSSVDRIMSPDVLLHMDGFTFRGRDYWKRWVGFLQSRKSIRRLELVPEEVRCQGEQADIVARWYGIREGKAICSEDVRGTCQVKDGRIVDIQSRKRNYTMILGRAFQSNFVFFPYLLVVYSWGLFHPSRWKNGQESFS